MTMARPGRIGLLDLWTESKVLGHDRNNAVGKVSTGLRILMTARIQYTEYAETTRPLPDDIAFHGLGNGDARCFSRLQVL